MLPDLLPWLTLSDPYFEQISTVPKMFEPLKFDCNGTENMQNKQTLPWAACTFQEVYSSLGPVVQS